MTLSFAYDQLRATHAREALFPNVANQHFSRVLAVSQFAVVFHPPLPSVAPYRGSVSLHDVNWGRVAAVISQTYDVEYIVGVARLRYYPASIITVCNDLYEEWNLMKRREDHVLRLSEYPLLDVRFVGDAVDFFYSHEFSLGAARKPISGKYDADSVENVVAGAFQSVWSVIKAAERAP